MGLRNLMGDISLETTQQELLAQATIYLAAILERMPRVDANDRAIVNTSDQGNVTVAIAAAQTLSNVTTVSTVSSVTDMPSIGGKNMAHIQIAQSNAGCQHIYNNILVSA